MCSELEIPEIDLKQYKTKHVKMILKQITLILQTMNSQLKEVLDCRGVEVEMNCEPLSIYFSTLKSPPLFIKTISSIERGYLGKWAIINNELYLTEFIGVIENRDEITIEDIFPGKQTVFAEWFNGEIILAKEKLIVLNQENSNEIYEKDLHLEFIKGRLVNIYKEEDMLLKIGGINANIQFQSCKEI